MPDHTLYLMQRICELPALDGQHDFLFAGSHTNTASFVDMRSIVPTNLMSLIERIKAIALNLEHVLPDTMPTSIRILHVDHVSTTEQRVMKNRNAGESARSDERVELGTSLLHALHLSKCRSI